MSTSSQTERALSAADVLNPTQPMNELSRQTANTTHQASARNDFRLLIDGRLVEGAGTLDVINPATGRVLTTSPRADQAQLEQAVAAAKAAFPSWSATLLRVRAGLLARLAEALEMEQDAFARLLTQEQGKPLPQAQFEITYSIATLRYFATLDLPLDLLSEDATQKVVRQRKPLGVVAAITPWNLPMLLLMIKVAPALLAGNTVVAKPAPTTPLTTLKFGQLCARILPPGVVNVIVDQNDLGAALTAHPDVAMVAFTGSTATGKKVMASAAGTVKRLTLELGGNDAAIVLDDADSKEVAPKIFTAATLISGQACIAIKRLYVHNSIYDAVCDELAKLARETIVGDGLDPTTQMGPLQNRAQFEKVKEFLEDAREHGKIIAGGSVLERDGYFIEPTIVRDIPDNARLVREEQFGPVLPVLRYSDLDEVIARANDTEFGLGGSVWSRDPNRAFEVATQIHSGTVWVNQHLDIRPDIPHAGAKQSGMGVEQGQVGLEEFTQETIINMAK
jgi:acyl-CoA reductase-like NAD-dependent aldehyde dehydrogenase